MTSHQQIGIGLVVGLLGALLIASPALIASPGYGAAGGAAGALVTPASGFSTTSGASTWAYGVLLVGNHSSAPGGPDDSNFPFQSSTTFGYAVVINQTNTTNGFRLEVSRTVGVIVSVVFCPSQNGTDSAAAGPSCTTPRASFHLHLWERSLSFDNFTDQSNVTELSPNATVVVAATGLENASTSFDSGLNVSLFVDRSGVNRSETLTAGLAGSLNAAFSPALGVVPVNLTAPEVWMSTAAYTAHGVWNGSYLVTLTNFMGSSTDGGSLQGTLAQNGTVTLLGRDVGRLTIGGIRVNETTLRLVGNDLGFQLGDAFVLYPRGGDFFDGEAGPWARIANPGGAFAVPVALDFTPGRALGHFGLVASRWSYSGESQDPGDLLAQIALPGGSSATPAASSPSSTFNVTQGSAQGQPESPNQAYAASSCLVAGSCSGAMSPTGPFSIGALSGTVAYAALGAVALAAIVGAVAVQRRRRAPPPRYPNASLYPPGTGPSAGAVPPAFAEGARPSRAPRSGEPPEDDPLRNLW